MRGLVKWFSEHRRYGFLRAPGSDGCGEQEFFFHVREIQLRPGEERARLLPGEPLEFELGQDHLGRTCAIGIRRVPEHVGRTLRRADPGLGEEAPVAPGTARATEG